jgi:hypothetical protein
VWRHKPLVKELRVKKHRANSGDNVARKRQPVATTKKKTTQDKHRNNNKTEKNERGEEHGVGIDLDLWHLRVSGW